MAILSENVKKELANVLDNKSAAMFVAGGKLFSLEVHETHHPNEETENLAQELEEYPELRESLHRFLDNPGMKRYTAKELKELRYEKKR